MNIHTIYPNNLSILRDLLNKKQDCEAKLKLKILHFQLFVSSYTNCFEQDFMPPLDYKIWLQEFGQEIIRLTRLISTIDYCLKTNKISTSLFNFILS